ncbi:MAG: TatD family hydrolase [Thermoplasmata archaeon]|nr:TatD family hydrolase [Thermoplasmata archaeon]
MGEKEPELPFPILDNHLHLDPAGANVEAVREFQNAGGTHIVMCYKPLKKHPITQERDYRAAFEANLKLVQKVQEETNVTIFLCLGPYPVDLVRLAEVLSIEESKSLMLKGMELAAEYVREGKCIALGEIGRPHFNVPGELIEVSNQILKYGMELAKEIGCPVVLHTESSTPEVCKELAEMADNAGLMRDKVVKHYSPPLVLEKDNFGIFPSVLATEPSIKAAIGHNNRFLMETDFLDDPKRPGAVLGIKTVPKRTRTFLEGGFFTEKDLWAIHQYNPEKIYGVEIEI